MTGKAERLEDARREPLIVHCDDCRHQWTAAYTPMELDLFARVLRGVRCPMCGASGRRIFWGPARPARPSPRRPRGPGM